MLLILLLKTLPVIFIQKISRQSSSVFPTVVIAGWYIQCLQFQTAWVWRAWLYSFKSTTANIFNPYCIFLFLVWNFLDKFSMAQKVTYTPDTEIRLLGFIQFSLDTFLPIVMLRIQHKRNVLSLSAAPLDEYKGSRTIAQWTNGFFCKWMSQVARTGGVEEPLGKSPSLVASITAENKGNINVVSEDDQRSTVRSDAVVCGNYCCISRHHLKSAGKAAWESSLLIKMPWLAKPMCNKSQPLLSLKKHNDTKYSGRKINKQKAILSFPEAYVDFNA